MRINDQILSVAIRVGCGGEAYRFSPGSIRFPRISCCQLQSQPFLVAAPVVASSEVVTCTSLPKFVMLAFKTWSILQKDRDCSSHALILRRIVTTTERTTSYYETVRHISRCTIFEVLGAHAEPSNLCRVKEFKQVHPLLRGSCKSGGESMRNSPVTL